MHEAAIAQSIVKSVLENANQQGGEKVTSVEIELGELSFLNEEQVGFWVQIGFKETVAENAKLEFTRLQGLLQCRDCHYKGPLKINEDPIFHMQLPAFQCPECESPQIEIIQGREAIIRRIHILKK